MKRLIKNIVSTPVLLGEQGEDFINISVEITGKKITNIFKSDSLDETSYDDIIDGGGYFLSPGLCDPQVHFREPGLEYKEDILSGSLAASRGGFTTVISMPNTAPVADNSEVVSFMINKSKEVSICRVIPTGAVTYSLAGNKVTDFNSLKEAGAIAFTDDGKGIQNDDIFFEAMKKAASLNMPILDHSEDESLSQGGCIHKGQMSENYSLKGIDPDSESVHVARGCLMSEQTGCHYHILHISTQKSIEHLRSAKARGLNVTAEVSPHHLLLCDEMIPEKDDGTLDANWKMNPPLRSVQDRLSCIEALLDGTIDAIATDHAPHSPEEKQQNISHAPFGIIGLETAFPLLFTNFVKNKKITISRCIDLMSKQAGDIFNLNLGRILVGTNADLALFDLESAFYVDEDYFASKSKNSPFIGQKLFGETKLTMMDGNIVFDNL